MLKMIGAAGLASAVSAFLRPASLSAGQPKDGKKQNVVILVFDTLSARHMSLYGYPRATTPNIEKFSQTAVTYHRNYASSNFTQSSAVSLLTGVYPWSHRSLDFHSSLPALYRARNIFSGLSPSHKTVAYTHNPYVLNMFLEMNEHIDLLKRTEELALFNPNGAPNSFVNDPIMGYYAAKKWRDYGKGYSLFLHPVFKVMESTYAAKAQERFKPEYPLGLSDNREGYRFKLEDAIDWIARVAEENGEPFFGYFHMLPPHDEYKPRADFLGMFADDGYKLPRKPEHFFTDRVAQERLDAQCQRYDEYIALVDSEFGRLVELLKSSGVMDNTCLILTSDHGELFERGVWKHNTPLMYESLVHIPLVIHKPGQEKREDVHTPTSIVDLLPTVLRLAGHEVPDHIEGRVLPGLGGKGDPERMVFSLYARQNPKMQPIKKATLCAIQMPYKLIAYRGYDGCDNVDELYDLENDPEELDNLAGRKPSIVSGLKEELRKRQSAAEQRSLGG